VWWCRLQDEKMVYQLICEVQKYLETREGDNRDSNLCRIYIRRVEHLYYKVKCCHCYILHIEIKDVPSFNFDMCTCCLSI